LRRESIPIRENLWLINGWGEGVALCKNLYKLLLENGWVRKKDGFTHLLIIVNKDIKKNLNIMKRIREKMKEKIDFVLKSLKEDFTLRKLEIENYGKGGLIKVFVDKPGGVTINDCAKISEKISVHLEVLDCMHGPYRLEVSSPGTENKEEK
jgi:hypothetical protein